jgi:glucan 1,3-beta-glucosidase
MQSTSPQFLPSDHASVTGISPFLDDTSRTTSFVGSPATEQANPMLPTNNDPVILDEKTSGGRRRFRRWPLIALGAGVVAIIIALAVALPVTLVGHHSHSSNGSNKVSSNPHPPTGAVFGGNGTEITTEDGITFMYVNNLGGTCEYNLH